MLFTSLTTVTKLHKIALFCTDFSFLLLNVNVVVVRIWNQLKNDGKCVDVNKISFLLRDHVWLVTSSPRRQPVALWYNFLTETFDALYCEKLLRSKNFVWDYIKVKWVRG